MRKYEEGERDYQAGMTQLEAGKSKLVSQMGASSYEDAVEKIYAIDKALETGEDLLKKLPTIEGEISKTSSQISQVDRGLSQIDGQLSALKNSLNNPEPYRFLLKMSLKSLTFYLSQPCFFPVLIFSLQVQQFVPLYFFFLHQ